MTVWGGVFARLIFLLKMEQFRYYIVTTLDLDSVLDNVVVILESNLPGLKLYSLCPLGYVTVDVSAQRFNLTVIFTFSAAS